MNLIKIIVPIFLFLLMLTSCNQFEKKLFNKIEQLEHNGIKNDTFNLEDITDFDWEYCLIIPGNESVPELKEFIEEILNDRKSTISWEERVNGKVDKKLTYKADDLPVNTDRFYFLTYDKQIITEEIEHYGENQGKYFELINSNQNSTKKTNWIRRKYSKIVCN